MSQREAWNRINRRLDVDHIVENFHHPLESQSELRHVIDSFAHTHSRVIEVGCGTGVTSLLLDSSFSKTVLDFDLTAVSLVGAAARRLGQSVSCLAADMFRMPIRDESFDLLFSSGVIEHYDRADRVSILAEYARLLAPGGVMLIAFPNHYSFPYRSAYIFFKSILRGFRWTYPAEYKLYDLQPEMVENHLRLEKRQVLAKKGAFYFWGRLKLFLPVYKFLTLLDRWLHFEGYLTVLLVTKP